MKFNIVFLCALFFLLNRAYPQTAADSAYRALSGAYGELPHSNDINPTTFTYEVWAYIENTDVRDNGIIGSVSVYSPYANGGIEIVINQSYALEARITDGNTVMSDWVTITGPSVFSAGAWYHLAITFGGGTFSFYVNGSLKGSASDISYIANTDFGGLFTNNPFRVGAKGFGAATGLLQGAVDELRIWNIVRTPAQIIHDMTSSLTGTESGLVGYWRFDEGSGTTTADQTGNGRTMNISGDNWIASGAAFPASYAYLNSGALTFGKITVGTSDTMSVTVTNLGSLDLTVSSVSLPYNSYTVVPSSFTITPDSSQTVNVIFAPVVVGGQYGNLVFNHNATGSQSVVSLSASGVDFQDATDPGHALRFVGQYMSTGTDPTSQLSTVTFETWARVEGGEGTLRQIVSTLYDGPGFDPPNGFRIFANASNQWLLQVGNGSSYVSLTGPSIVLNEWTHLAFTTNGSASRLYINGNLSVSVNTGYTHFSNSSFRLGGIFNGTLDEVRIWSVARTGDEIRSSMNSSIAGNETDLRAYWRMDDTTGIVVVDWTGNGFDGSLDDGGDYSTISAMRIVSDAPIPAASCGPRESSLNFGLCYPSQSILDTLWIVNFGGAQLVIDSLRTSQNTFSISPLSSTIASHDSAAFVLTFTPGSEGEHSDTLTIYHQANGSPISIPLSGIQLASEPNTSASSPVFSSVSTTGMTIRWSNGTGAKRIVIMKAGGPVDAAPGDGQTYGADANFGSGSQIGAGNFIVSNGTEDSVHIVALTPGVEYHVAVVEYNGSSGTENYRTSSPATGSQTTLNPTMTPGSGTALSFNGTTQYVGVPDDPSLRLTDNLTIEAWIYPTRTNSSIIDKGNYNYLLSVQPNGESGLGLFNNGTWIYSSGTVPLNEWSHVSLVFQTGTNGIKFYRNGVLLSEHTASGALVTNTGELNIGRQAPGECNCNLFEGYIDEVRMWDTIRTAQQIRENMHKTLEGTETGLLAYWQFNEGSGSTVTDSIGGHNGTLQNNPTWTSSTIPIGGGTSASGLSFTSGTMALDSLSLTTTEAFDNAVDLTATVISVAPNILPASYGSIVGGKYFVVNLFGNPGTFSANLTLKLGAGGFDAAANTIPAKLILYKRSSSSSDAWEEFGGAVSANSTTGEATWSGITSFSQFAVVYDETALPVELLSFTVESKQLNAELKWETATEVNNYGFEVQRSGVRSQRSEVGNQESGNGGIGEWAKVAFIEGSGSSSSPKEYTLVDKNLKAGKYSYRLKQIDNDGKFKYSQEVEVNVGSVPKVFALEQNYPNPFNPTTTIGFTLQQSGMVTLKIYDAIGREVATLVNEHLEAGVYYQKTFNASNLSTGIYFARLQSEGKQLMKKMLLVK